MKQSELIEILEKEWDVPDGFFFGVRNGFYDPARGAQIRDAIASLDLASDTKIEKRLVSLLWYLPLFLEWQKERVEKAGGDGGQYRQFLVSVTNILEEKLGVP